MVLQMASYTDPKQVWDGLKTRYLGVDRVISARVATLKRELESLRMKEGEMIQTKSVLFQTSSLSLSELVKFVTHRNQIAFTFLNFRDFGSTKIELKTGRFNFATKLIGLASKARTLGYELKEVDLVKRLFDSMPMSFLQIVASIEQCFELDKMLFDEAVGRLKAYEERIKGTEKIEGIQGGLLLASEEKTHGCKHCGHGSSNREDFGRGRGRGRGSVKSRDVNERVRDKSRVRCFKCGEFGHFNNECPTWEKQANLIEEEPAL
ncbi:uncharacterized protein [Rutidosis leptorrhynchoides]|uniref:uncharacterized protein n=1 Tax=Rutidosis leptorrhynchoides TaxID=125765 RepID=UPI003A992677